MTRIKICGVTRVDDAVHIAGLGVDFIGLNFWPHSKRYVALDRGAGIARHVRAAHPATQLVGVFVDPTIDDVVAHAEKADLDIVQLHGVETPELCAAIAHAARRPVWKAIPVASSSDIGDLTVWPVDAILLDAPSPGRGGAGLPFDHHLAKQAHDRHPGVRLVLAGGLNAANVAAAVRLATPWCVDVASGVESAPGVKEPERVEAFVAAFRSAM
jgi:phosphoribosylanthranilate isomerase